MKFSSIRYLTEQGIENIWKNRMMAFASFCVLLVSLLLIGGSILAYENINSVVGGVEEQNEIIVYMEDGTPEEKLKQTETLISAIPNVGQVQFRSKDEEYLSLKERMGEYDVLFDALGDDNPLIDSFRVKVQDISQMNKTISQIQQLENVMQINAPYEFVSFLIQLRVLLTWVMGTLIAAMIIVSVVIISNTTRTSVYARREEIHIMKYVGATDAFIHVPFFIEGMVTGFLAGCGALVITWLVYTTVVDIIQNQVVVMNIIGIGSIIPFHQIYFPTVFAYLFGGALVGAIGSAFSTRKYINV